MIHIGLEPILVSGVGAVAAEAIRVKLALEALQKRQRPQPRSKPVKQQVTFPRLYFIVMPIYFCCVGFAACLLPVNTNDFIYFYVGAAFPKFVGLIVDFAERVLKSMLDVGGKRPDNGRDIDDTSIQRSDGPHIVTSGNRVRPANGLYAYLTA